MASRSILTTDKLRYFAITEFNNCFIIQSLSLFFIIIIIKDAKSLSDSSWKQSAIFTQELVSITHEQNNLLLVAKHSWTVYIAHEQTIICRQLFAGHMVCSRPIKRKKKCSKRHAPIITVLLYLQFNTAFSE